MRRRTFVATTAGLGTALIAGCSGGGGGGSSDGGGGSSDGDGATTDGDGGGGGGGGTGFFRLLISDQPAAIEDFDSLTVSFEKARVFRNDSAQTEGDDPAETETSEPAMNGTETSEPAMNGTETSEPAMNGTVANETMDSGGTEQPETGTPSGSEQAEEDEQEGGEEGFTEMDLDGATVDLTEVVGEKAIGVFDGELSAGTYTKIELHASDVEGIVDGEEVAVKIPSEKLQIVKPFEVRADESTSFVFDINVVKKGSNGYNLLPVISKSGVTGTAVEVEEVEREDDDQATPPEDTNATSGNSTDA